MSLDLEKALKDAKEYRDSLDLDNAIAILHQVTNKYPKDNYFYLLAATYLEAGEVDSALEYADKALEMNNQNKEAYELKGFIFEEQNSLEEAESMYLKVLEIDYDYYDVREKLVELYLEQERYEDVIKQCEFVLSYKKFDFSTQKNLIESTGWKGFIIYLCRAHIHLKQYEEAIKNLLRYKELEIQAGVYGEYDFFNTDSKLYKLYLLAKNEDGIAEYKNLLLNHYELSEDDLKKVESEAYKKKI